MDNLNQYFKRSEFECKCARKCGFDTVDSELIAVLTDVRVHFNLPVIINSACRCFLHNQAIGGRPHSYHLSGRAADIRIPGIQPENIYQYLDNRYPGIFGILCYKTFIHIDTRSKESFRMQIK